MRKGEASPPDMDQLLEKLAALEHERWAHWQRYMHSQGQRQADGSLLIPMELVTRWEKQIRTDYRDLTEEEKQSDREQVRRYLPVVMAAFGRTDDP